MRGGPSGAPDAIVIGGGFAGLAAATALAEAGARVVLLEGRPYLGGRARSWIDPETGAVIDNGQHIFMGCYRETLAFLARIGTLDRLFLQPRLEIPWLEDGGRARCFTLPDLPAPWDLVGGLLRYPGLGLADRARLLFVADAVRRAGSAARESADDLDSRTVAGWLGALRQSREACRRLWYPLAISALNENPEMASAGMFVPVLRAAFLTGPSGSRLGLPRSGLSELYAEPAGRYLRARGSEVRVRAQARRVLLEGGRVSGAILTDGERIQSGAVIAAVPPESLLEILPPATAGDSFFARAARLLSSPIVSVYLWFGSPVTDLPFAGLVGGEWQWIFNRHAFSEPPHGEPGAGRAGGAHALTLVSSAARDFVERPRDALVRSAVDAVQRYLPASRRAAVRHALVIKEKRATIAPVPGGAAFRPPFATPCRGLFLAGDWTSTGLPATIEGAVLSGHACARLASGETTP